MATQKQADAAARQLAVEKDAGMTGGTAVTATQPNTDNDYVNPQNTVSLMQKAAEDSSAAQRMSPEIAARAKATIGGGTYTAPKATPAPAVQPAPAAAPTTGASGNSDIPTVTPPAVTLPEGNPALTGDASLDAINGLQAFGDTEQGRQMANTINEMLNKLASGTLTPDEQASVQASMDAAKAQYDQLIQQAEAQKKQGMAKSIVGAGQRGGFMNTQFSGIGALQPLQGESFVGTGGELNRIQSEYDLNISNLKAQQISAVAEAQKTAREAIRTGLKDDLTVAENAYNIARTATEDHNNMVKAKVQAMNDYQTKQIELSKYNQDTVAKTIDALAGAGYTAADIPEGYFSDLDKKAGYNPGTSAALFDVAKKAAVAKDADAQIKQAQDLTSIMADMKVGGPPVVIGSNQYSLLNHGDSVTGTESSGKGQYLWTTNLATGEISVRQFGPPTAMDYVDYTSDQHVTVRVYEDGTRHIFDLNQPDMSVPNPQAMKETFPDGTKPTDEQLAQLGLSQISKAGSGIQCGQYFRYISGYDGASLSSIEAKKAIIDPSIGTAANPPQAGDAFIQNGGSYGHIGMVLGSVRLDDGSYQISITDANHDGKGTISYRTINSKNVLGFSRVGLSPEFQFGTDVPGTSGSGTPSGITTVSGQSLTFGGSDGKAPTIAKINGVDMQWDPTTATWVNPKGSSASTSTAPPVTQTINGKTYQWDPASSSWVTPTGIPDNTAQNATASKVALQDKVTSIDSLIKNDADIMGAVGPNRFARYNPANGITGGTQNFIASVQQLTAGLTLDQLIQAKAQGATFGALSEGELGLLAGSATKISNWALHEDPNDPSKVTGYNTTEAAFKKELETIKTLTQRAIAATGSSSTSVGGDQYSSLRSQLEPGEILAKDKNGNIVAVPSAEFNASVYTKI